MAYNTYTKRDRLADLDRLIRLAEHAVETWPDTDQADAARVTLGEIALGRGRYDEAATWLETVRDGSSRRLDAQVKAGDARWRLSQALRAEAKAAEADAQAVAARELIAGALKAREEGGAGPLDPGRIVNSNALAEIHRAEGRPAEAAALLEPIATAFDAAGDSEGTAPLRAATLSVLIRAHLAMGRPADAIAEMKALESASPSPAALTQLYYEMSKSLEAEVEAMEARSDPTLATMRASYATFLDALAASEAGQSYESREWAAEAMLDLAEAGDATPADRDALAAKAETILRELLAKSGDDSGVLEPARADPPATRRRLADQGGFRLGLEVPR